MASVSALRDVLARLSNSDQEFAQSLIDQAEGRGLSEKQAAWVDKLVARASAPKAAPVNVMPLVDFMHDANVKRPSVLLMAGEQDIRLAIAGPSSRAPGYVVVTTAHRSFDDRKFFGRISPAGDFEPSLALEPETQTAIIVALQAMALDPAGTAAAFGRMMGWCCFCRIPLSDARSLHVGYGRICARKYNLPWAKE